jgi:hypothetical protein
VEASAEGGARERSDGAETAGGRREAMRCKRSGERETCGGRRYVEGAGHMAGSGWMVKWERDHVN